MLSSIGLAQAQTVAEERLVSGSCERTCLEKMLDEYLNALANNEPQHVLWTTRAKLTENSATLRIGEGLWATASGMGKFRLVFADPKQSSIAFYGTVYENGSPVILALRLKLDGRRVAEAEHIVSRNHKAAAAFDQRSINEAFTINAPKKKRASRQELADVANAYFDGLSNFSTDNITFANNCNRIEGGTQTTNVKDLSKGPMLELDSPSWRAVLGMSCADSLASGANAHITEVRERRIVVIDEEQSVAVAVAIFAHTGTLASVKAKGYERIIFPTRLRQPFDSLILEAFKLDENKKVSHVEAVGTFLPYGLDSGWVE